MSASCLSMERHLITLHEIDALDYAKHEFRKASSVRIQRRQVEITYSISPSLGQRGPFVQSPAKPIEALIISDRTEFLSRDLQGIQMACGQCQRSRQCLALRTPFE